MNKLSPFIVVIGFTLVSYLSIPKPSETAKIDAESVVKTVDSTITPPVEAKTSQNVSQEPSSEVVEAPAPVEVPPAPIEQAKWHDADCEQYRALIARYDWDVRTMMAIMEAESTNWQTGEPCDAQVVGDTSLTYTQNGRVYGYSKSLLQVRQLPGREHCDTDDPEVIVECGYRIWQGQGYSAWSVYTNGKYAKFLR